MKCALALSVLSFFYLVAAQEKIFIGWKSSDKTTSHYQFGSNDFDIDQPQAAVGTDYREALKGLGLQFFRFHNEGLTDAWTDASSRTWNITLIKEQLDNYEKVYGDNFPAIIMTIPTWPSWMSTNKTLDGSLYSEYADLCASLVNIINVQLGRNIKYWEPFNELDIVYRPAGILNEMYALYAFTSQVMTKADPSILVGGPAWATPDPSDTEDFLRQAGPYIAFVSWHMYIDGASSLNLSNQTILNDTLKYVPLIKGQQDAVAKIKPGTRVFMDEYNVFYQWNEADPRLYSTLGAVWYASMHRIIAETGLSGATNWNARDTAFGLMTSNNTLRFPAYIFKWSNAYFVGSLANSTSSYDMLEVMAVSNSDGASVYLINKGSAPVRVIVAQDINLLGTTTLILNKVNATGVHEGLSLHASTLQTGLELEAESVWCLHNSVTQMN